MAHKEVDFLSSRKSFTEENTTFTANSLMDHSNSLNPTTPFLSTTSKNRGCTILYKDAIPSGNIDGVFNHPQSNMIYEK